MTTGHDSADQILLAAATDKRGLILENFSQFEKNYIANKTKFGGEGREFAAAQAAMDHLVRNGYIKKAGGLWELTDKGWQMADTLNKAP
jgi:hypothetical protein